MEYEAFLCALETALRTGTGIATVERVSDTMHIHHANGAHIIVNPANFWLAVESGRNTPSGVIAIAVQSAITALATSRVRDWTEIAPHVVARLERRDMAEKDGVPWRAWTGSRTLRECLVEDAADTMRRITTGDVNEWGVPLESVYATGRQNLWQMVQRGPSPRHRQAHLWVLETADGYGASRLLFPDWLERVLPAEREGWVLAAPTRNILIAMPVRRSGNAVAFTRAATGYQRSQPNPWPSAGMLLRRGELMPLGSTAEEYGPVLAA